jgi:hypothetical protein
MRLLCLLAGMLLGAFGVVVGSAWWWLRDLPAFGEHDRVD